MNDLVIDLQSGIYYVDKSIVSSTFYTRNTYKLGKTSYRRIKINSYN